MLGKNLEWQVFLRAVTVVTAVTTVTVVTVVYRQKWPPEEPG